MAVRAMYGCGDRHGLWMLMRWYTCSRGQMKDYWGVVDGWKGVEWVMVADGCGWVKDVTSGRRGRGE
jgi:hypothetical protein